jgi:ATP synthase F1 complex assembly factor 2
LQLISERIPGSFFSERPESLAKIQQEHWIPVIDWAREKFGIDVLTTETIMFSPQPDSSKKILDEVMQTFDLWQMAGASFVHVAIPRLVDA